MKIKQIVKTIIEKEIEVTGVTLLSVEEYYAYKNAIPPIDCWWWLRSPGVIQGRVEYVEDCGYVYKYGEIVNFGNGGVRPALIIKNYTLNVGDEFKINGTVFTVISQNLAITNDIIGNHTFDIESNNYENSEIKEYVEDWWNELRKEVKNDL